jgi:non-canonical (house-cleaning) NTP pyrophosphatase
MSRNNDPGDNDDDDLYEDLIDTKVAAVATGDKKSASSSSSKGPQSFAEQVETSQQHAQALERENLTLKRNIGTLFRTAKRELERKDTEIQRLQQELSQQQRNNSSSSG